MHEVRLKPVTFAELSQLRHEVSVSEGAPFAAPEFLVVRYVGSYRDGAEGKGDALYIVATAEAARKAWYSHATVLDFRELEYHWGDNMEWVTGIGWDPGVRAHEPLAIVVGDKCRDALRSLLREKYQGCCVDAFEDAFALCRQQWQAYAQRLKEIRDRA
jgi:hypothetical protein